MRKRILTVLAVMGVVCLGGIGCGASEEDLNAGISQNYSKKVNGDLSGQYQLSETNCGTMIEGFKIDQAKQITSHSETSGATITIVNDGGSPTYSNGDIIRDGNVYYDRFGFSDNYVTTINSTTLGCAAFLITEETISSYQNEGFVVAPGYLWAQCKSSTGICIAVFK